MKAETLAQIVSVAERETHGVGDLHGRSGSLSLCALSRCHPLSVGILVQDLGDEHSFAPCFLLCFAIMFPTHDELVLIAATNQPAIEAVAEAEGTPAVPGKPAHTPSTATLAWVGIHSDAWSAFNEELGGVSRVRDVVSIPSADWENAIAATRITTDTGTVPLEPLHKGQLGSVRGVCRLLMNLPAEDLPQRRDGDQMVEES